MLSKVFLAEADTHHVNLSGTTSPGLMITQPDDHVFDSVMGEMFWIQAEPT
jgi:hypothetical protein